MWLNGVPRVITGGQLIEDTDPVYMSHKHLFEDVQTFVSEKAERAAKTESATAGPGEMRTVTPPSPATSADLFDPSEHSVRDVLAHLDGADEDEVRRVLDAEEQGQSRKGITSKRAELLPASEE